MARDQVKKLGAIVAILIGCTACSESPPPPAPAPSTPATSAPATPPPSQPATKQTPTQPAPTTRATPPQPPASRPPAPPPATAPADPTVAEFVGFAAPKPVTWLWQPPSNRMRAANFVVPGASGEDQAHLVIFRGIGGGADANITRWTGQFRGSDGEPVEPIVESITVDGRIVTLVELRGEQMATGARWFTPDRLFLAAVFEGPQGPVQAVLSGSAETVDANRDAFMSFVKGLKYVGGGG